MKRGLMERVKNAAGKTIRRVDHIRRHISIVYPSFWPQLWFDGAGHFNE